MKQSVFRYNTALCKWRRRRFALIIGTAILLTAMCACSNDGVGSEPPSYEAGTLTISFDYEKQSGYASNQFAVWIEDMGGDLVKTLYATRYTANGGYKNRPDSIFLWVDKSGLAAMSKTDVDAVSGATPAAGTQYYTWDMTDKNNNAAEYVGWLPHHSIEDTLEWLRQIEWKRDDAGVIIPNDNYIWGFVLKETGELFGSGGLIWEEGCQLFQVGYNIKKTHWNNGFTTEAMRAIFHYAVTNLGIKRVAGGHAKENLASAKVIEKLGFVYDRDDITPHVDGVRHFDSREYYLDL